LNAGGTKVGFLPSSALAPGGAGSASYVPTWNSTPPVITIASKNLETPAASYKLQGAIAGEQNV
jgi:hypothetical protein